MVILLALGFDDGSVTSIANHFDHFIFLLNGQIQLVHDSILVLGLHVDGLLRDIEVGLAFIFDTGAQALGFCLASLMAGLLFNLFTWLKMVGLVLGA